MNLRTVLLSPTLMMEQNIFVIFAILTLTLVSAHFDDVIQGKQKQYSSVPNRSAGPNKRAGETYYKKIIKCAIMMNSVKFSYQWFEKNYNGSYIN